MTDAQIYATYRVLKINFAMNTILLIGKRCINFRGHTIRINSAWASIHGQSYPCNTPEDLIRAMAERALIRPTSVEQLIYNIERECTRKQKR